MKIKGRLFPSVSIETMFNENINIEELERKLKEYQKAKSKKGYILI